MEKSSTLSPLVELSDKGLVSRSTETDKQHPFFPLFRGNETQNSLDMSNQITS